MIIPNCEKAHIPEAKVTEYLLSETHAIGKAKAKYFRPLGYTETNIDQLAKALLMIVHAEEVTEEIYTAYGIKYVVEGRLATLKGITVPMRTVWVVESGDDRPRFVTAYPA